MNKVKDEVGKIIATSNVKISTSRSYDGSSNKIVLGVCVFDSGNVIFELESYEIRANAHLKKDELEIGLLKLLRVLQEGKI